MYSFIQNGAEKAQKHPKSSNIMVTQDNTDAIAEPLKGRNALMAMYKQQNPEMAEEPDEDSLFDFAGRGFSERDEYRGKYDALNGANEKLAQVVSEDPRFAQWVAMVADGENPLYALGKTFGNIIDELDDASLEQLRSGQEEFKNRFNQVKQNFSTYEADLKSYCESNGYDAERMNNINNAILDIAEAFNDREIPTDIIELVDKGLDYDNEKSALSEAEKLAIKNETIEGLKSGANKPASPLPDLQGAKKQPENRPPALAKSDDDTYKPYTDRLEVVSRK